MASFSFNTLQQKHLFAITLSKYPSTLKAFKFHYLPQFPTSSPLRHSLEPRFFPLLVVRAHVSHTETSLSITNQTPTKTINLRTGKETGAGFSSVRAIDERVVSESVKDIVGLELEEKKEMRLRKDKYVRKNLGFRERRKMGSGGSSLRSKDENVKVNSLKSTGSLLVKEKMEKKSRKGEGKRSRKNKVDLPEVQLRVALDMCSKRGDVLGAIQLYDLALREGNKMEQYHYTLLLYLCSSAALGVIHPAKSGRGNRTLNTLDSPKGVSVVNSIRLSALRDKGDRNLGGLELNVPVSNNGQLVDFGRSHGTTNKMELNSSNRFDDLSSTFDDKENITQFSNGIRNSNSLDGLNYLKKGDGDFSHIKDGSDNQEDHTIRVGEDVKKYALQRGFEIYEKMCSDNVPMNEATLTSVARMAMSMGIGDVAFDMVKQMKPLGINPRLRSYGPALSSFCNIGDIDKAFAVEKHMLEHGVYPEEPELEALLRVSVGAGKGDKVYYLLHKLRTTVRKVSTTTADLIVKWFNSKAASRVGKTKWDKRLIKKAIENGGGGWHGQGWLGKGRWNISYTTIGAEGLCKCCGEKLAIIDLDPKETENFGESVASIAIKREKISTFQKFQKWLDYYGPFEAVVDAANVGLFGQSRFVPSKVGAVVNGIRQKLPSKKWPLIILHNKRLTGRKMDEPVNRALIEKWKNADALYATPTGSNDDWYWLYAAIKFKCLLVTNDEMRDHTFQLLGNDFFPKWKERHQVHFSFSGVGPVFHMPPPCSVVIQESDEGHWHIPVISELDYEAERTWLCVTRDKSRVARQDSATSTEESQSLHNSKKDTSSDAQTEIKMRSQPNLGTHENTTSPSREIYKNLRDLLSASVGSNHDTVLSEIEAAEKLGNCIIDFQI